MSILAWLLMGLIAGFIASKLVNRNGGGVLLDIALGVVGAFVGGWLFSQFGNAGVSGFNLYSLLVATIGAVVILALYHLVFGRRAL
ncbi:GlsB/YeaQ/YmgE family stress response membrane protein [Caulobacter vibrioides]|nr:GlsB/YeaQ/YmgE family stress response membrane protein [Caulobacter vibrioides]QXZ53746.1 GlsB/YeaQ/YmgE family stress response membrane protein [Caulobacter vibrioides]